MFLNTMINAIQAMETGGTLKVTAERGDKAVRITIADTGTGIPRGRLDNVFDLFYSTKKAGEGTGLGMWMTYELVKKYRGTDRTGQPGGDRHQGLFHHSGGNMSKSILIVEDNPDDAELAVIALAKKESVFHTRLPGTAKRRWTLRSSASIYPTKSQ